ncbi:hypothetical protein E2562_012707 [Oryza meyeriana var. granulata]|uniref:Protein kinase domain-containing protein n=1 Tax=Oryza meyeriana var. granulata TaxID=110450 RepID=A0A6G1CFS6_9ORYZ|nr:hypothetical protein E2562_012707 [Oryza meyeriana var. granulata]
MSSEQLALVAGSLSLVSLLLLGAHLKQAAAWEDKDFFSSCPPSRCSEHGPEIRFPFRLNSSNTPSSCGLPCMKLACSDSQDTILDNYYLGRPYKVTAIDYRYAKLTIIPLGDLDSCPLLQSVRVSNPKISDFGLAKLCARDQSIVTLTAARGTMGYIAPELYSRNFGEISYKSDVYSFGMLVLEMVSGRRNSDPSVESQNEVYFPEWIYEQVTTGQDLALPRETMQEEKATMRQLAIVALWCIQWNPKNRPSMTKVPQAVNIAL